MDPTCNCAEDYSKRKFKISADLSKKDWYAVRAWTIFSTDQNFQTDGTNCVPLPGNDPIPNIGQQHPQYSFMIVDNEQIEATDNPTFWIVTVNYRYIWNFSLELNPLMQPPRWRFLVGEETVPCWFDKDGNPIVNSAGDFFDPQPQDVRATLSIRITRNESNYDANKALQYMNSTNSDTWTLPNGQTVQPGQARMHSIEQGGDVDKNSLYVPVIYIAYLIDTDFNLIAVDQGFQAWGAPGKPTLEKLYNAQNSGGSLTAITAPALLDGMGGPMVPANYQIGTSDDFPAANPNSLQYITRVQTTPGVVGLKFKQLKTQSFNALSLV